MDRENASRETSLAIGSAVATAGGAVVVVLFALVKSAKSPKSSAAAFVIGAVCLEGDIGAKFANELTGAVVGDMDPKAAKLFGFDKVLAVETDGAKFANSANPVVSGGFAAA